MKMEIIWNETDEAKQNDANHHIGKPQDWYPYFKAGWGFRRIVTVPPEYMGTDNHLWTDYEPYWRDDLNKFIWTPAACGSKHAGEQWKSARVSGPLSEPANPSKDGG